MTDEALNDPTAKPAPDEALNDAAAPEPADFDLLGWLSGLGPEVARYPLPGGGFIPLRARTLDWRKEWAERNADATDEERALDFLAAHVVDDRIAPESLAALAEHRPKDFDDVVALALLIDEKPSNQISPRFLPAASD